MESQMVERTTFRIAGYKDRDKDRILDALSDLQGMRDVSVDSGEVKVSYDPTEIGLPKIKQALLDRGCRLDSESSGSPTGIPGGNTTA